MTDEVPQTQAELIWKLHQEIKSQKEERIQELEDMLENNVEELESRISVVEEGVEDDSTEEEVTESDDSEENPIDSIISELDDSHKKLINHLTREEYSSSFDLSDKIGMEPGTVKSYYPSLKELGLIETKHGIGVYLTEKGVDVKEKLPDSIDEESEDKYPNKVQCPECGQYFGTSGISMHIRESHDMNMTDLFKVDGQFWCSICEEGFETPEDFNAHNTTHGSTSQVLLEKNDLFLDQDESYEEKMIRQTMGSKSKNIKHADKNMIEEAFYEYIDDKGMAIAINELLENYYNITCTGDERKKYYMRCYNVVENNDSLNKGKIGGKTFIYRTDEEMDSRISSELDKKLDEMFSKKEWNNLKMALSKVLPPEGEKREIDFKDFSEIFEGSNQRSTEEMWMAFISNDIVHNAIKHYLDNEQLDFSVSRTKNGNKKPAQQWVIEINNQ